MTDVEVVVATALETAWRALRDRAALAQWHGWQAESLAAEIEQIFFTGVVEDPAARTLVVPGGDRFEVREDAAGHAHIALTRAPLAGDPELDAYHEEITEGWTTFLHQLRFLLERKENATRRTLYFDDRGTYSGTVVAELGLDSDAGQPGSRYTATLLGEPVAGEVWFAPRTSSASPSTPGGTACW